MTFTAPDGGNNTTLDAGVQAAAAVSPPAEAGPIDPAQDPDGDQVTASTGAGDNCSAAFNAGQSDTSGDGFGNACDADYDNDGVVGGSDFARVLRAFGSKPGDPLWDADLDANGDGLIGGADFSLVMTSFGKAPGPSDQNP